MQELQEGTELSNVFGPERSEESLGYALGVNGCTRIVVTMENAQMSMIPWARVDFDHCDSVLVNLTLMESVALKKSD